jgi:hypothetical protein
MKDNKQLVFLSFGDVFYDQRLGRTIKTLQDAGFVIHVFARHLFSEKLQSNYRTTRYKPLFKGGPLSYIEFNLRALIFLLFRSRTVVCSIDLDTLISAIVAKKLKGHTVIYDAHEYFVESPELVNRPFIRNLWNKIGNYCIPRSDYAYTVGEEIADEMEKKYKIGFEVVRNIPEEVDLESISNVSIPNIEQKQYILYQGALNVGRGIESLIEVMQFYPELHLVIAGKGDLELTLKKMTAELHIDNITFTGNLLPIQLKSLTQHAWIGVNLLENMGKSYYLSLANKFFDYIQANIPQICIDFPEYRKINSKYNFAVMAPDCSVSTLKTCIETLINDSHYYDLLKANTVIASKELNWNAESKKLTHLYQKWTSKKRTIINHPKV